MGSSNLKDILTCFSPSLDFFAISSGDGRIKIWDTLKGELQTEFTGISSLDDASLYPISGAGHLSVDYTCMKWMSFDGKKKLKLPEMLVLGTGSGDVVALDVAAGQLRWRFNDCHPGGVSAISYSEQRSCIYTAGADGMVCEVDPNGGNFIRKFKASTKAVSTMSVSSDGKIVATASAQLKIFNCSDHSKMQKFSGHPGQTRCLILTEDGKYTLSSAVGDRYVAIWGVSGSKKQSASAALAMDHPAIYLDAKYVDMGKGDAACFCVLAISEIGVCYLWYGKDVEQLQSTTPTKISLSLDDLSLKKERGSLPAIFAAKIQSIINPASAQVYVAHGLLFKPNFQKVVVHHGNDLKLKISHDVALLPLSQSQKSKKRRNAQSGVTALDRANAEDASLPMPKVLSFNDGMKPDQMLKDDSDHARGTGSKDDMETERPSPLSGMEERLRSLGLLSTLPDAGHKRAIDLNAIDLQATLPEKRIRAAVRSMKSSDAHQLLTGLVSMWQSRECGAEQVLPWIYNIIMIHRHQILSEDHDNPILDSLYRVAKYRASSVETLMKLRGRLRLLNAQIDKASQSKPQTFQQDGGVDESEGEEDVDEVLVRGEDGSPSSSDVDDDDVDED